tara:strand:+ start:94 stop:387 length:294 start_codon:yes stop_codon:yes gene_type:complete
MVIKDWTSKRSDLSIINLTIEGAQTHLIDLFNGEGAGPSWQNFVTRIFENDKDGDGLVSREEMPKRMIELFELGDINNDESISRREAIDIYNRASRR